MKTMEVFKLINYTCKYAEAGNSKCGKYTVNNSMYVSILNQFIGTDADKKQEMFL